MVRQSKGSPPPFQGSTGRGLSFFTHSVSEPRRVSNSSSGLTDNFCAAVCVPCLQEPWRKPPCFLARVSSLQLLLFLDSRLSPPTEEKKRSRMFGKICRSVEHFLHWCKGRGGQRGRGGRGRVELQCAPGHGPPPHVPLPGRRSLGRVLTILDPFSGPTVFALEETPIIPPQ